MVTSVPYAAELVCLVYAGRADSENRIKALKEDLSLDTFCLHSFDATDAACRLGCVAYNLLAAGFRETVLPAVGLNGGSGRCEISCSLLGLI
jgi:hypothetical protein